MNSVFSIKQIDRDNIDYLIRNLENFDKKNSAIRSGLSDAGKVFAAGGKRRLKSRMKSGPGGVTGKLLKSFKVRLKKKSLGVLIGFTQEKSDAKDGGTPHAHLVDQGTNVRYLKKRNNKSVGRVIGNSFWYDTESQDYPQAMEKLYAGIEKAVNRINNRL